MISLFLRIPILNKKILFDYLIISISFIAFTFNLIRFSRTQLPIFKHNIDPGYEYLLNGINLIHFQPPGHLDHPGFPLQILIAITFRAVFVFRYILFQNPNLNIKSDFVLQSEVYALGVISVLMLIQIISVLWLCKKIYNHYKSIFVALYPILIFSNFEIMNFITTIRPESLLFSLTNLLIAFFISYFKNGSVKKVGRSVIYMGIIVALGILTKIIFAPFLVVFFFLKQTRFKLIFTFSFLSAFITIVFPIRSSLSLSWFINIVSNRGRHGDYVEPKNFLQFLNGLQELNIQVTPYFYLSLSFFVFFYFFRKSIDPLTWNVLFISITTILLFSLLNIKDASPQDFISLTSLCSLVVVLSLIEFKALINRLQNKNVTLFFYSFMIIFVIHLVYSLLLVNQAILNYKLRDSKHVYNYLSSNLNSYVVSSFKVPTQFSALMFGNFYYGPGIISDELYSKYPKNIEFNIWDNQFYNARGDRFKCQELSNLLSDSNGILVITDNLHLFTAKAASTGHSIKLVQKVLKDYGWSISQVNSIECKLGK